jgi:hypothetical protein
VIYYNSRFWGIAALCFLSKTIQNEKPTGIFVINLHNHYTSITTILSPIEAMYIIHPWAKIDLLQHFPDRSEGNPLPESRLAEVIQLGKGKFGFSDMSPRDKLDADRKSRAHSPGT